MGRRKHRRRCPHHLVARSTCWPRGEITAYKSRAGSCDYRLPGIVTTATPGIAAGMPERKPIRPHVLQTASGETLLVWKGALVKLPLDGVRYTYERSS
jgi:hypothetical protein